MAEHAMENKPIIESLGGRPRATVPAPRKGGKVRRFVVHLYRELLNDNITGIGAMMAYYAILSLFPMMVFIVTLALLVLPEETVLQGLAMATQAMPAAPSEVLTTQVTALMNSAHAGFAIGGAALALWGASRGASSLMGALNAMFNIRETRAWWRRQLIAIAVTLFVAVLVIVALALLVAGPAAGHWLAGRFGFSEQFDTVWELGRWAGAGLVVMVVWAVMYRFLANTSAPFRIFTPGAFVGVLLWLGISYAFG